MKEKPKKIGKYIVLEKIARGAMGVVYKAEDPDLRRTVAIKLIHDHLVQEEDSGEFLARFSTEGTAASRCNHPNIVSVFDYFVEFGSPRLVMEYVDAPPLSRLIQQQIQKRPTIQEVIELGVALGNGLGHAHEKDIVHRDIKPSNILMADDGIKIVDFGVARIVDTEKTHSVAIGTPRYMSPEQTGFGPDLQVDGRADLYSSAVVLYEFATGRHPFRSKTPHELYKEMSVKAPPRAQNVPDTLADVLQKAMAPDRDGRFVNAETFTNALRSVVDAREALVVAPSQDLEDTTIVFQDAPKGDFEPLAKLIEGEERERLLQLFKRATEGRFRPFLLTSILQEAENVEELVEGVLKYSPEQSRAEVRYMIEDFARQYGLTARIGHSRRVKISSTEVQLAAERLRSRYGKRAMTIATGLKQKSSTVSDFRNRVEQLTSSHGNVKSP